MKFVERMNMYSAREACIRNNWCTRMDNTEYSNVLMIAEREFANHEELIAAIEEMASLIYSGSELDAECEVSHIAGIIFRQCVERFVE